MDNKGGLIVVKVGPELFFNLANMLVSMETSNKFRFGLIYSQISHELLWFPFQGKT